MSGVGLLRVLGERYLKSTTFQLASVLHFAQATHITSNAVPCAT